MTPVCFRLLPHGFCLLSALLALHDSIQQQSLSTLAFVSLFIFRSAAIMSDWVHRSPDEQARINAAWASFLLLSPAERDARYPHHTRVTGHNQCGLSSCTFHPPWRSSLRRCVHSCTASAHSTGE